MIITNDNHMIIKNHCGKKQWNWRYPKISMVRYLFIYSEIIYVVRRRGRLAPCQPLSVCALLPAPRREQASTASWKPRPPFEAAKMD